MVIYRVGGIDGQQITAISKGTLGGFGVGIIVSTVFLSATTPVFTLSTIFTNLLTLVLTAIGFGFGLGDALKSQ